jgi:hypothetical protein
MEKQRHMKELKILKDYIRMSGVNGVVEKESF